MRTMAKQLDTIGWYIATMHQILGHDKAAAAMGQTVTDGEREHCILCKYERGEVDKTAVTEQIGVEVAR